MPKITDNTTDNSKRAKREAFDSHVWPQLINIARQAIDSGDFGEEEAVYILSQYLKGQNPGVKAADLRELVSDELNAASDDQSESEAA